MRMQEVQDAAPMDEFTDRAARGVGRAIAFEAGHSHALDERALATARGYATMAGDSLGRDVRACLKCGNVAAVAFDTMILEFAVTSIVTTLGFRARTARV